jgi:high-affinity K+ transport system ATPase subunit B
MAIFPYHRSLCLIIGLWLFLSLSTTSCLLAITINVLWRYEDNIRKISFHWSIQNLVFFCIEVGFILYVCCYVKLIQQQIVSLLLLFGLSFILIYVERAITVKHFQTKVKAVSLKLWCYQQIINQFSTHSIWYGSIGLITSMKQLRSFQCSF